MILTTIALLLNIFSLTLSSDMFSLFLDEPTQVQQEHGGLLASCVSRLSHQRALLARCRRQCGRKHVCRVAPSSGQSLYSDELVYMHRQVKRLLRLLRRADSHETLADWLTGAAGRMEESESTLHAFTLHIQLRDTDVQALRAFVNDGSVHIADVDEIFGEALNSAQIDSAAISWHYSDWFHQLILPSAPLTSHTATLATAVVVATVMAVSWSRLHCGWRSVAACCVFTCLLLGCVTNWRRLYQQRLAERHVTLAQHSEHSVCEKSAASSVSWLSWLPGMSSSLAVSAECVRYHQLLETDPMLAVSVSEVVSVTLSEFVLTPAEQLGDAVGKYHASLAAHLSWWQLLPVTLIAGVFLLTLVSMLLGYELRLLMGMFSVGPARASSTYRSSTELPPPAVEVPPTHCSRPVCCGAANTANGFSGGRGGDGEAGDSNMVLTINSSRGHVARPARQNVTIVLQSTGESAVGRSNPVSAIRSSGDSESGRSRSQLKRLTSDPDCRGDTSNLTGGRESRKRLERYTARHRTSSLELIRHPFRRTARNECSAAGIRIHRLSDSGEKGQEEERSPFLQELHRVMDDC